MTTFQLDESLNSRRFALECAAEGACEVHRYPNELKGKNDEEVLPDLMSSEKVFVTSDREIAQAHSASIPKQNAGMIIVTQGNELQTLTISRVQSILRSFKESFPQWQSISWANSIVTIGPDFVQVGRVESNKFVEVDWFRHRESDWPDRLEDTLQTQSRLIS